MKRPGSRKPSSSRFKSGARAGSRTAAATAAFALAMLINPGGAAGSESEETTDSAPLSAIESLEPTARELWPTTFGGVWGGEGDTIHIAFTKDAEAKVAGLAERFPRPELLRAVEVERSLAELEALQDHMIADRERAREGTFSLPGVPGHRYDLGMEIERNAVRVILENRIEQAIAAIHARYGEDVIVEEGALPELLCTNRARCYPDLRSGLVTSRPNTAWNQGCSTAFSVRLPSGARGTLSAAHCGGDGDDGSARYHDRSCILTLCLSRQYGIVARQRQQGRVDAESHGAGRGGFTAQRWIYVNDANKAVRVGTVGTWDAIVEDKTRMCKSGYRTGKSCGKVIDKRYSPYYVPNGGRFVYVHAACAYFGDSGSGVYKEVNWNRAEGILSGGLCKAFGDPASVFTFGHIEYAQNALDVTVVTSG